MSEISIVVPVYKAESYLHQCVDSVLAQTFTGFELILVDDGSPDNCGVICDEYAAQDSRIRVIHQKNGGLGKARNVGMDLAGGKYLIFLDSDDYWLPSTLETLFTEAECNKTQVLVFGAQPFMDGIEEPEKYLTYRHTVQNGIVRSGPESLKVALDSGEYYSQACLRFYLLKYIQDTGIRFDEGCIHEDVMFSFLTYLLADRVECIGNRFYQRRYHSGSIMTGKSIRSSAHGYRVAVDGLLDAYRKRALSPLGKVQLERFIVKGVQTIRNLYNASFGQKQNAWQTAGWIRKDARQTLKRARTLTSLPRSLKFATYSLFLSFLLSKIKTLLKRPVQTVGKI